MVGSRAAIGAARRAEDRAGVPRAADMDRQEWKDRRRDNEDHQVGDPGTAGTHRREGRVSWGIEKGHGAIVREHDISANVLRNPSRFTRRHVALTQKIQQ